MTFSYYYISCPINRLEGHIVDGIITHIYIESVSKDIMSLSLRRSSVRLTQKIHQIIFKI
jgi:hypothetical protein